MNKILLKKHGRNHIRILPTNDIVIDDAEATFNHLQNSENAVRHSYHRRKKKGYLTTVYELDDRIYLTNCIKDFDGNYVTNIYVMPLELLADALAIEKFLVANIEIVMEDYKQQLIDALSSTETDKNADA